MRVRFLGTGTSHGVPMIGCDCDVCHSNDPRDRRLRSSIVIETDDGACLLVDTTTDLRAQALRAGLRRIDAILYTHAHADHVFGFDEVRRFNMLQKVVLPAFGAPGTVDDVARTFAYAFRDGAPRGGGVPQVQLWPVGGPFSLCGVEIVPIPVRHGPWDVLAFRIGAFAYVTDCNAIPESSRRLLEGVDVLVLDALRRRRHPTHFSLDEAKVVAADLGARQTYFTHIAHELGHAAVCAELPPGMTLAYDDLVLDL